MNNLIHTEEYKGYIINVFQDDNPESPREWDNLGAMYCFHRHYNLGDKHHLLVEDLLFLEQDPKNESLPRSVYPPTIPTILSIAHGMLANWGLLLLPEKK